ncbi:hypothetical protein RIR_jg26061.t1 [Rhizophagus irregularis DAOM 181602=DAOM 197198]|nr:hypothetical protein RIR_jg26061.t1 [Rhizophagus irregularis DAOM 181602=DAOM 197198]
MNIRHFLRSIADARALLSFCSLARFTALGSPSLFDWTVAKFRDSCLSSFLSLKLLDSTFQTGFSALDC